MDGCDWSLAGRNYAVFAAQRDLTSFGGENREEPRVSSFFPLDEGAKLAEHRLDANA